MNLFHELERLTEPPPCASPVRVLSDAEVEHLLQEGSIMPVGSIPLYRGMGRVVDIPKYGRGIFGRKQI